VVLGNYFAVQVPLTKYNALGSVDYRLTDHVTAYGQFNFSHSGALDATSPAVPRPTTPSSCISR